VHPPMKTSQRHVPHRVRRAHVPVSTPLHPYSRGLLASIPVLGAPRETLEIIPGVVPSLINLPTGCRFADRCVARVENDLSICTEQRPELLEVSPGHNVRCWLYAQETDDE